MVERKPRAVGLAVAYHLPNRRVARSTVSEGAEDYPVFERVLAEGLDRPDPPRPTMKTARRIMQTLYAQARERRHSCRAPRAWR